MASDSQRDTYGFERSQQRGQTRAPQSRIGHDQRKRLCPACGYNLVATVAANVRTCPECGQDFQPQHLKREVQPGEWTEIIGVRNAAVSLFFRSIAATLVWALFVGIATPLFNRMSGGLMPQIASIGFVGVGVGFIMSHRLVDRAGMTGPFIATMAIFATAICVFFGSFLGSLPHTGAVWFTAFPNACGLTTAAAIIAIKTMVDT